MKRSDAAPNVLPSLKDDFGYSRQIATNRPPLALTKKEVARELGGVCVRTVDTLIKSKALVSRRIGRRRVVLYSSVVAFLRRDHQSGREQ